MVSLDSFLTFINQQNWNLGGSKTLLAVSGGIDSVVMLHLFHKAGFDVGIAHCNFGLRGDESTADEHFVRTLAERYGYPFHTILFDTKSFVREHAVSTQMAARSLRYNWFDKLRIEFKYSWIATAHHANDSFETSLLNFVRGTGLAGLDGVPITSGNVIRPLLFATRANIEVYLHQNDLLWREDRSNASLDYKRNIIRHEVVPTLKKLNPSLERTFEATAERLAAADVLLGLHLTEWAGHISTRKEDNLTISIEKLLSSPKPAYGLWFIVQHYGFSYEQSKLILETIRGIAGKQFYSNTHTILRDRNTLLISENKQVAPDNTLDISSNENNYILDKGSLHVRVDKTPLPFLFEKDPNVGLFDMNLLQFPLILRPWLRGDSFQPLGMKGKRKKLSDLFIDAKIPLLKKHDLRVLVNGNGDIIWVVGLRMDERFKVSDATRFIFTITFTPDA
jgi:tRNA(Ile)-lysidine synthase